MKNVLIFAFVLFVLFVIVNLVSGYTVPAQDFSAVTPAANSFGMFAKVFGF